MHHQSAAGIGPRKGERPAIRRYARALDRYRGGKARPRPNGPVGVAALDLSSPGDSTTLPCGIQSDGIAGGGIRVQMTTSHPCNCHAGGRNAPALSPLSGGVASCAEENHGDVVRTPFARRPRPYSAWAPHLPSAAASAIRRPADGAGSRDRKCSGTAQAMSGWRSALDLSAEVPS